MMNPCPVAAMEDVRFLWTYRQGLLHPQHRPVGKHLQKIQNSRIERLLHQKPADSSRPKSEVMVLTRELSVPTLKTRNQPIIQYARLFAGPKSNLDGALLTHSFLHGKSAANASPTMFAALRSRYSGWPIMNLATT